MTRIRIRKTLGKSFGSLNQGTFFVLANDGKLYCKTSAQSGVEISEGKPTRYRRFHRGWRTSPVSVVGMAAK